MKVFLLVITILLTACASQAPQHHSYLLRSDKKVDSRQLAFEDNVFIGSITLADYINPQGLVLVNADGTVHQARYHEWAEPLAASLREFFRTEISYRLGHDIPLGQPQQNSVPIDIHIDRLHGNNAGEAVLIATWVVGDNAFQYSEVAALPADGYPALAKTEQTLLENLANAIATNLAAQAPQP